jgi:hypothetical protein
MKNPTYREWPPCDDYDALTSVGEDLFVAYIRAVFWTALCAGIGFAAWGFLG